MRVTRSVCIVIFFLFQCLAHSQEVEKDISLLNRFSVSLIPDYHYAPWTKLNQFLAAIHDEVSLDPFFNATGSYTRIDGDGSLKGIISYKLSKKISLLLAESFLQSTSDLSLKNYYDEIFGSDANEFMQYRLRVYSFGAGLNYEYRISTVYSLKLSVFAERAFGRMHFEYDAIWPYANLISHADMNRDAWAGEAFVGIKMYLFGGLSLVGSADYRLLRFPNFSGSGSYIGTASWQTQPWVSVVSPAELIEGDHYLGVHFVGNESYGDAFAAHSLLYRTPYFNVSGQSEGPALIDLSSFGGGLGLEFEF